MLNQAAGHSNNDLRKKIEDYSYGLKDVIGRGFSSVVYKGINDKTKQKVAIKVVDIRSIQGRPEKKMLDGEVEALKKLNHSNIIKCHDIFSTANNCYIITEFCNEGDLQTLLKKRQKLPEKEAVSFIRQIIMGFLYIAESGFLHRDLKPANILIKDKTIKIADFGFAKKVSSNSKETINVGSPLYMSPQALQQNIYTIKNDIWSIGVLLYEMLHGKAPWVCSNEKQLLDQINKNNIPFIKNISDDLKDLIKKCLTFDEKKRISVKELAIHPFVSQIMVDVVPQLLRKPTSINENIEQMPSNQDIRVTGHLENNNVANFGSNRPKILHHRNTTSNSSILQKQLNCHINWMRYLYRLNEMFPSAQTSGRYTLGLRFIIVKQLISHLQSLKCSMDGDNVFRIEGWSEYLKNTDEISKLQKKIQYYKKKYQPIMKQFKQWLQFVSKDRKLTQICDTNFENSQLLCMLGLSYCIEETKLLWSNLQKETFTMSESAELPSKQNKEALRLDFMITYYQLNGFLVDSFNDGQYFTRMSRLDVFSEVEPMSLQVCNLKDIEHKMKALEIIK